MVKCLPTMWETWVWSLGQEDALEKEMTTHSGILAWRIPWMEEPSRLQSTGLQRVRHDWATSLSLFTFSMHFTLETTPRQQPWQLLSLNSSGSFFSLRDQSSTTSAVKCLKTCFTFFLKLSCCLRKFCSIMARSKNSALYSMIFENCSLCFN